MRFALLGLLLTPPLLAAVTPVPPEARPERLPGTTPKNVVFILADDHRYDALGFLGHPLAVTPHLDALAREGAHARNAVVTTALCSPSRASILTGLYSFRHRVVDNNRPIPPGTLFFPQYLQAAGYRTAFIGKWHMGGESDDPQPGFDHWISFRGQGHYWAPSADYTLNVNGRRVPQRGYITDELTDYALEWLDQQRGSPEPFFLYLSHKAVHAEFIPAERHRGSLQDRTWRRAPTENLPRELHEQKPRWVRDQRNSWHGVDFPYHSGLDIEAYHRAYGETLRAVDDSVGRLVERLRQMGVLDDTLIVYMGDNGFMFGEHGLIDKRVAYEASIRVPLLLRCPSLFAGGTLIETVVANIDIAPTLLEAMGLATPPHFDGRSFLPLAQGRPMPWREHFLYVYYWEKNFPHTPTVFALRGQRYKYITYYGVWDVDELYDLQEDPQEAKNLLYDPQFAALGAQMEQQLYTMMEELGGMVIPLNPPSGGLSNRRLRERGGAQAADFPPPLLMDAAEVEFDVPFKAVRSSAPEPASQAD